MKKVLLLALILACTSLQSYSQLITENRTASDVTSISTNSTSIITFDDQGFTDGQSIGNPYSIANDGEFFMFTITPINGAQTTSHRYQTQETSCGSGGLSHITAGSFSASTWTIETTSGNEINLVRMRFNNVFSCFGGFSYSLTVEGFKDNISSSKKLEQFEISLLRGLSSGGTHFSAVVK